MPKKIILASASPRRRDILKQIGLNFTIEESNYHEDLKLRLPPQKLVKRLAEGKALAVANKHRNAIIIAADTIVVFRNKVLGKPKSTSEARQVLRQLSGKSNYLYTALVVIDTASGKKFTVIDGVKIDFRRITEAEIKVYVASGEPLDKAGSYAIQGLGGLFITKITGNYYSMLGMPIVKLTAILRKLGVKVLV
ncbi:MAG: Maf family protein [Patescibacteria group bacterium]|jgi:septum formation protein